jgi:anti-sigma B factor antagonist
VKASAIPLQFRVQDLVCGRSHTLILRGELDLTAADCLEGVVFGLFVDGISRIALNLSRLTFIDATGLRALLSVHERCEQEGCEFSVTRPRGQVQRLLELTGAADHLPFESASTAVVPATPQTAPAMVLAAGKGSR